MRILLYTGKGGVGKTSVSAATALRLSKQLAPRHEHRSANSLATVCVTLGRAFRSPYRGAGSSGCRSIPRRDPQKVYDQPPMWGLATVAEEDGAPGAEEMEGWWYRQALGFGTVYAIG